MTDLDTLRERAEEVLDKHWDYDSRMIDAVFDAIDLPGLLDVVEKAKLDCRGKHIHDLHDPQGDGYQRCVQHRLCAALERWEK